MKRISKYGAVWIAALLLFFALPVSAAWTPSGLEGKNISSLAEDPSTGTAWFAGTTDGDIYKSSDGTNWTLSSNPTGSTVPVLTLSIDPATSTRVYAGTDGMGVYLSLDAGNTWSLSGLETLSVRSLEIDAYNPSTLFAATNNGVFKSSDFGVNWQQIPSVQIDATDIKKIALNPADFTLNPLPTQTDNIYAAATGGLYKSADAGNTWSKLDTAGNGITSVNFSTLAVDPQRTENVFAGTSDAGMYRSGDGGNSWAQINTGLGSLNILTIASYPYASTSVLAGTADSGVYRTDSSGNNWYAWNAGNTATRVNAIAFLSPQYASIVAGTSAGAVAFDNAKPDLVVTALSAPSSANNDETITVTATIKNVGQAGTGPGVYNGNFSNALFFSADSTITTSDTLLGTSFVTGGLAPGAEATVTFTGTIPYGTNSGTYYIGVIADETAPYLRGTDVVESDEGNNAGGVPIQITRIYPDLIIVPGSIIAPSSANSGEAITVTATIKNVGPIRTGPGVYNGNFFNALFLSADSTITTSDTLLGTSYVLGGLAPGAEARVTFTGSIPAGKATGAYYIGVIADSRAPYFTGTDVVESDETNNALGQLMCIGTTVCTFTVTPSTTGSGSISPSTPQTVNYAQTTAFSVTPDTGYYLSSVTGCGGTLNGNTYTTGAITSDCTVTAAFEIELPDLIVTEVTSSATGTTGGTITVTNAVKNQGRKDATGYYVGIYLSADSEITVTDFLIGYRYVSGLAAGVTEDPVLDTPATIPAGLAPGTYYIGAIVDPNNFLAEQSETNNALTGTRIIITNP